MLPFSLSLNLMLEVQRKQEAGQDNMQTHMVACTKALDIVIA